MKPIQISPQLYWKIARAISQRPNGEPLRINCTFVIKDKATLVRDKFAEQERLAFGRARKLDKMKRAYILRSQGESFRRIAVILNLSTPTLQEYVKKVQANLKKYGLE